MLVINNQINKKKMKFNFAKIGMDAAGLGAGAVAAKLVNNVLPNLNPKLRAAGKVAVGVGLPLFVKNNLISKVGDGMVAVGIAELVGEFVPSLAGIGEVNNEYLGETETPYLPDDQEESPLN